MNSVKTRGSNRNDFLKPVFISIKPVNIVLFSIKKQLT